MKILLIYPAADFSTFDVARGIESGLRAEGHEVVPYRLSRRLVHAHAALKTGQPEDFEPEPAEVALHAAEGLPYRAITMETPWALFVSCMGIHPAGLIALRKMGVRIAGWFTEAPYETDDDRELHFAQLCDVAFVNERTAVRTFDGRLASGGGVVEYLRHAYDPALHHPPVEPLSPEDCADVLFVGTGFPERQHLLECIDWDGIDLRLGGLWPAMKRDQDLARNLKFPCLDNKETVRLYGGAKIVLNPHRFAHGAESANPRVYEAAACGAFQICDRRAEILEVFGDSVPTFDPGVPWQLGAMVRRYLADEPARKQLAAEALKRVAGETFQARAKTIVDTLSRFDRQRPASPVTPQLRVVA